MITALDRQRSYILYLLLQLCLIAVPLSEVGFRLTGSSIPPLAVQALTLVAVIALTPMKHRLTKSEAFFLLSLIATISIFLLRDIFDQGGLTADAIGNTLRCAALTRLIFAVRAHQMTQRDVIFVGFLAVLSCLATVVIIRGLGVNTSVRVEPVLLSYGIGLYLLRHSTKRTVGLLLFLISLLVLILAEKASLLLGAVGITVFMFPGVAGIGMLAAVLILPFLGTLLDWIVANQILGRFTIRVVIVVDLLRSFDRTMLAIVTSNRSEEYFYLFSEWRQNGFPLFGSGISATLLIDQIEEERSTFHNLYLNLVRLFGVASFPFFIAIALITARAVRASPVVGAVLFGLLLHNLLTFSLFHSPILYILLLFAPHSLRGRKPHFADYRASDRTVRVEDLSPRLFPTR